MKTQKVLLMIIGLVIAALLVLGIYLVFRNSFTDAISNSEESSLELNYASVEVIDKSGVKKTYSISFANDDTLFTILRNLQNENTEFKFGYKEDPTYGPYLESVNSYIPVGNEFWKIVVNGADAQEGIGTLKLKDNDVVRFEVDEF